MPDHSHTSRAGRIVAWTRATFLGWSLGFVLLMVFIALGGLVGLGNTQFPLGLGMGTGVGAFQRRLIAGRVGTATHWWRASIIGVSTPFVVWDLAKLLSWEIPHALVIAVVAAGLSVGGLQWRALRAHGKRSGWWVPASLLGWTLAAATVFVNDQLLPKTPGIVGALLYIGVVLLGGVFLGVTTGVALEWVLRAPAPGG
jgi:hypothetical protein